MFQGFPGKSASSERSVRGEQGDFFSRRNAFYQLLCFERDTVGVDREAYEYEIVFIKNLCLVHSLDCFVSIQDLSLIHI